MEKYICDKCGHAIEVDLELQNEPMTCDICHGRMLSAKSMQEKDDMAKMIDEDKGDEDYSPEQDATDEAVDLIIIEGMNKNMKELGNNGLYMSIESLADAKQRTRYRKYFLMAGGQIPAGEPIEL